MKYQQEASSLIRIFPTRTVITLPTIQYVSTPMLIVQHGPFSHLVFDTNPRRIRYNSVPWTTIKYNVLEQTPLEYLNFTKNS
jgi:hypothetical protein